MKARLSILAFPQRWLNNKLTVRALIIPRNIDPTLDNEIAPGKPAWSNATMALQARLITDPEKYPSILESSLSFAMNGIAMPANTSDIFQNIEAQLGGINRNRTNNSRLDTSELVKHKVRKYLPESYRNSFNFTSPRTKDAAIDDSYHCAIQDNTIDDTFKSSTDTLSWGKVFGFCLRQPALAERVGFVYEATFDVNAEDVKNGGWLYIDLAAGCSYKGIEETLVKRYAARIPKLKSNINRSLFAAVQFPVLISAVPNPTDEDDPIQPSNFDELLIESAQYDDGFCKIVHANQPVSSDLLKEKEDKELPVITDAGIRLAWDDEQLLIWMNRQMKQDNSLPAGRITDAPMGVLQYRVDVRLHGDHNKWLPLCKVSNKVNLMIGQHLIDAVHNEKELGVEVYPAQLDARKDQPFWLPQYFANWIGKSLVLQDEDAIKIFKKEKEPNAIGGFNKKATINSQYEAADLKGFQLLYGNKYDFRVRLADISGGGPSINDERIYDAPRPEGYCDFRRYVQPQTVRLINILPQKDYEYFTENILNVRRPLLGYPSILFTGRLNAVNDLIADATNVVDKRLQREVGLPDIDVESVEVVVEIKTLEMDMELRHDTDSRESYAKLYVTKRMFPAEPEGILQIPIKFVDTPVLNFTDSQDLGELGLDSDGGSIDIYNEIVLPTSRDVRITLRPLVIEKPEYYADTSLPRKGKPVTFITRKASKKETSLFKQVASVDIIRGIWLQPDTDTYLRAALSEVFVENNGPINTSSMMERLTDAIDKTIEVESKGLSLLGKQGARIQFGASRFIRHNMSPDSTSITFSTKSDLLNHWIVPITLLLNRDWTWDGVKPTSFDVYRQKKFVGVSLTEEQRGAIAWETEELVGDIEMKQVINIQALYNPDRSQTYLCFIDAVEPKLPGSDKDPEEMMVRYRIHANIKSLPNPNAVNAYLDDDYQVLQLHLPITTKPSQVPKIVSAGIAQSKYVWDELYYSSTEPRKRYLWVEFEEKVKNPNDTFFIRMLAYAPDPLLARFDASMLTAPEDPSLSINPEPVRIISPNHTDDKSGLSAMQELIKADDSDVHYLVPLPPGMHAASPELFGFFTYEFRMGHKIGWSTAQGRFGSALRITGAQHPLPQLFCTVNRDEKHIMVTAPFAQTVFNGADVTSNPPRTQLWALLYAQVKRADDKAYRNILLDDQLLVRQKPTFDNHNKPVIDINTDAVQYGITGWRNKQVIDTLRSYGLPEDSSLSVLVVELLPTYDKFVSNSGGMTTTSLRVNEREAVTTSLVNLKLEEGMFIHHFKNELHKANSVASAKQLELEKDLHTRMEEQYISEDEKNEYIRPLTKHLGSERILRTSTLVPVPDVCCTDCD